MIRIDPNEGKEPTFCDVSGHSCFNRCPARYCFRYNLDLVSPDPTPPMDYGTAVHCAMPFLQRGDLQLAIEAFDKSWTSFGHEADEKRNLMCAARMLKRWHDERILPKALPYEILDPPQTGVVPETRYSDQELAFAVDLGDDSLLFCGRIDALARHKQTRRTWVVEYKTTSELGPRFISAFDLNSQLIGYATAASVLLNEEVEGAFLEALRVTSKDQLNLCIPKFIQPHHMEAFIEDFKRTCVQIQACHETREWSRDFSACAPYPQFGTHGYMCEYKLLCDEIDWRDQIEAYKIRAWKPFKELKDAQKP